MNFEELKRMVENGEDSQHQFKRTIDNERSLSSEIVAMSNSEGGWILLGVSDEGECTGIESSDLKRINNVISNTSSQHIKGPVTIKSENISIGQGKVVVCLRVLEGIDKPYFDNEGIIWLKVGADKRRINSKEELRRFFQMSDQIHADETPTKATIDAIHFQYFSRFLEGFFGQSLPNEKEKKQLLLENLGLLKNNYLNLAGLLLFGDKPQLYKPSFIVKSIFFPGTTNDMDHYLDKEDHEGYLYEVFQGSIGFIMRCLPKMQTGRSVNSPSAPEISRIVFEELLVNALVHRDYFCQSPIRIFVYQDRIEIISPGSLPNHLTVQKIKSGISIIRNPILCSYMSKGILPYSGLGTGIQRALEKYPHISFLNDKHLHQFKVVIHRRNQIQYSTETLNGTKNDTLKDITLSLIRVLQEDPTASYEEIAHRLHKGRSTIYRTIVQLRKEKKIRRKGSKKTGYWEIINQ